MKMTKTEMKHLIENGDNSNANIQYTPEMIAKYTYDNIMKQYSLEIMPDDVAQAYNDGYFHIHDMEYYPLRPNCMNYDIRFFARNGLKIDGLGLMGSTASPAKSLKVLLNHMLQALMAGSCVFSGGQSFTNFNTFLAPFAKDMSYDKIKQEIQGFIFNCNMSLIAKGGQCIFTSIGLDVSMPEQLRCAPAVSPGGIVRGVYADYQEEFDLILKAVLEVLDEKDSQGRWHRFPNTLIYFREGDFDEYNGNVRLVHELGANNPTLYYVNATDSERIVMGALTSDTPVMTDKGFKYPNQLSIGDIVMTYAGDGCKEWNRIYNVIPKPAPSKVFKITCDNNYMFKVTDNHKLPTSEGIVKSEDLKVGMELYNYLDEFYTPTNDYEAEFIGMFLADGYIRKGKKTGRSAIEFHIKKDWKKEAIIGVCDKCNYEYDVIDKSDGSVSIFVREYDLKNELYNLYDSDGVKHFPNVWYDKNKIANVIKGLMLDSGRVNNRFVWSCSDLPLVTDVLYALSMIGRENTLYVDNRSGDTGKWGTNYRITFGAKYKPNNRTRIKSIELVENNDIVYDLSVENNANYVCGLGGIHSENCRTQLNTNWTGDYDIDCFNGNFAYYSLNLPLIAKENKGDFFSALEWYCELIYKGLHHRLGCVEDVIYNKKMSTFLLQEDCETGRPLYDLGNATLTIGFVGLYESLVELDNMYMGQHILEFLNEKAKEFHGRDGLRWSVIASPAESTAFKFAKINRAKYPDAVVQGEGDDIYLTNSSHIPVCESNDIIDHIRNADKYHNLSMGGNICHIFDGEIWSEPEAIFKFNSRIAKTNTKFWAYSKQFSYCRDCNFTINDNVEICPICGSRDLMLYDRITGYYLPVRTWNEGKVQEQKERYRHDVTNEIWNAH